jgi:2',3'-cyclic-nucleotide 2'-phosphodiesterase (5'-nucleotidase family)
MKLLPVKHFVIIVLALCNGLFAVSQNTTLDYNSYKISKENRVDSSYIRMLQPYKDSLSKQMDKVIGFAVNTMYKKQPECALGNLMADCVRTMAEKKYNKTVDVGMVNFGGIRSYISKGDITVGKVFELMPFDNMLIIQQLRGDTLQLLLNRIAEKGGWPISGLTMQIKGNQALNVVVGGKALDSLAYYTVANSDYIANGGDDCNMLKPIPQTNGGYIIRDAIVDYIKMITEQGNPIDAKTEKRITYAN